MRHHAEAVQLALESRDWAAGQEAAVRAERDRQHQEHMERLDRIAAALELLAKHKP